MFGDNALSGSNQFILLIGGAIASIVGYLNQTTYKEMLDKVADNFKSVAGAILILLFVGALAGSWLVSGIIPAMIYYGLKILNPSIFLPSCIIICLCFQDLIPRGNTMPLSIKDNSLLFNLYS